LGGPDSLPEVTYLQVSSLRVSAEERIALEVDGEYCGETPVEFRVLPRGLEVIVP
jgi:diacylglycerol kinase family enzyme